MDHMDSKSVQPSETLGLLAKFFNHEQTQTRKVKGWLNPIPSRKCSGW